MFKYVMQFLPGVCVALLALPGHALEVGDQAPDFDLPGSDGKHYKLADYRGKQAVVLAWFPKASSYGCTIECKSLAENGDKIRQFDVTYAWHAEVAPETETTLPRTNPPWGNSSASGAGTGRMRSEGASTRPRAKRCWPPSAPIRGRSCWSPTTRAPYTPWSPIGC